MLRIFYLLFALALITGCKQAKNESGKDTVPTKDTVQASVKPAAVAQTDLKTNPRNLFPMGMSCFQDAKAILIRTASLTWC